MKTRIHFPGRPRDTSTVPNSGTIIFVPDMSRLSQTDPHEDFEQIFRRHYDALLEARRALPGGGVVLAAIHDATDEAELLCLASKGKLHNSAIIGRHVRCDLVVDRDPSLSLRHLAVLVAGGHLDEPLSIRVLDLHTPRAFVDESGRKLCAVLADGPVFLRLASYSLLVLPGQEPWPEDGAEAWGRLPARRYRDTRLHESSTTESTDTGAPRSQVVAIDGPLQIEEIPATGRCGDEERLGTLLLKSEHGSEAITVGSEAAARGILLGRYRRCASSHLIALANRRLSRVQLLILHTGDGLYAIDTAATNETRKGSDRIRSTPLEAGTRLTLPGDVELEWQPVA